MLLCSCSFPSDDYVMIFQGGRKVRRLSGVYRYGLFGWRDHDDDCDDDGDDGDGDDRGDGDGDGDVGVDFRRSERVKRMFGYPGRSRFGFPMRSRHLPPYVIRMTIPGTGELIAIVFKSDDDDDTEKGFEAVYRVSQGEVCQHLDFIHGFFFHFLSSLLRFSVLMSNINLFLSIVEPRFTKS